ncbi:MAG: phosphopentomutase [Acidobacteria bacterium]|nr:phosphopentomutase [Acidobacteriota bacterium]
MPAFRRIVWVVLDSVGIGAMPDAAEYGDPPGSDTLGNIARLRPLRLPNFARLGLGNIRPIVGVPAAASPSGAFGRCALASPGKDTTTGHWEMVGIHLAKPFPLYPQGFPPEIMEPFERAIGRRTLGNYAASGTEIMQALGEEHVRTGSPIVYTSADSVFQIAAHEDVIPLAELYRICEIARGLLGGVHEVGRVIARPFTGAPGSFKRTANRHDYAVPPPEGMLLDRLTERNVEVVSVGKISDVYLGRGIAHAHKTKSNADGMEKTLLALRESPDAGLIFVNLVDFDSLFGHRNDVEGYARALEEADAWVPRLEAALAPGDVVLFTADHGCDPTTPSTDHSREYVPVLACGRGVCAGVDVGTRRSLADLGQTVAENFGAAIAKGESLLAQITAGKPDARGFVTGTPVAADFRGRPRPPLSARGRCDGPEDPSPAPPDGRERVG